MTYLHFSLNHIFYDCFSLTVITLTVLRIFFLKVLSKCYLTKKTKKSVDELNDHVAEHLSSLFHDMLCYART